MVPQNEVRKSDFGEYVSGLNLVDWNNQAKTWWQSQNII
jgi:hypothetical protein